MVGGPCTSLEIRLSEENESLFEERDKLRLALRRARQQLRAVKDYHGIDAADIRRIIRLGYGGAL